MKLLILAKAAREAISTGRGIPLASLKAAASRSSSMPREGDRIEFRSDRLTDKGPATGEVKTIKATVDGYYLTVEFADGQATLSWDDMGAERVKPGLWLVKARTIVEAIRAADAETRAKVRADFGMEFASEGGYAAEVIDFHGLQVVVENPVGSVRAGIDPDGKPWATELTASYGYISGTEGADGDMVDVFIGPDATSTTAYVARCQVAGKWGDYDEDKVMLGFPSEEAAREAFLQNYNDPRFLGGLDAMSIEKLKERMCKPGRLAKSILLLSKAHISAYTKKDGTFVPAHDDRRQAAREKDPRPGLPETLEIDGVPRPTRNSKGQPIHPTEEGVRNFWKWFGDAGLVDDDGFPVPVHHGGGSEFSGIQDKGRFGKAIFVKQGSASGYGDVQHELYLRGEVFSLRDLRDALRDDEENRALRAALRDELTEDDADELVQALTADEAYPEDEHVWDLIGAIDEGDAQLEIQKLRGKLALMFGASAVETPDEFDGDTIMVVDPLAIKSATGNSGDFNRSSADITKSLPAGVPLLILCKAHVGPYLRGGKLVNLTGYQGRQARARVTAGQMGLFSDLPPAEKPKRKKADDMARFGHETTGDLFADADEHGEVPPGRRLMPRRDTVTESRQDLIAEHERLLDVLRSPSHEDDKEEAKKQADELAEYKQGEHDHLLADIQGAKWKRGKGRIAGHYGVEVGGEVLGNFHEKPEDAVAAAKQWMATRAAQKAEAEKRSESIGAMRERLLAGGEVTDMDLKLLGLRQGAAGLEWFVPAAAEAFGISSRAVRPYIKDMISIGHTINGAKKEFVPPKKALQAIAASISDKTLTKSIPVLFIRSDARI